MHNFRIILIIAHPNSPWINVFFVEPWIIEIKWIQLQMGSTGCKATPLTLYKCWVLCAFVLKVNIQNSCFLHDKHFSMRPHPGSLESACLEWMTCCVVWFEFMQHKKQLPRSSMACPALPFLNNLSRQLEWLFYEYALKIPFLCSFSLSLCMSVCAQVCVRVSKCVAVCMRLFSAWNKGGVRAN